MACAESCASSDFVSSVIAGSFVLPLTKKPSSTLPFAFLRKASVEPWPSRASVLAPSSQRPAKSSVPSSPAEPVAVTQPSSMARGRV